MRGLWLIGVLPGAAGATTWTVDPSDPSAIPKISAAILSSVSGDRVEIVAGTYSECLDTDGKDLELEGLGGSGSVRVEGTEECESTLIIQSGESVALIGLTLQHALGRALEISASDATLTDVEISGSGTDSIDGGGVYMAGGSLWADQLVLTGNTADRGGHLLMTEGAQAELIDCWIEQGIATRGAAVFMLDGAGGSGDLVLSDCTVEANASVSDGGALYLESSASLVSSRCQYTQNQPEQGDGGAIYLGWASSMSSTDDVFTDNGSADPSGTWGGAIALGSYAQAQLDGGIFSGNTAGTGGAISASYDNDLVLSECSFSDQLAEQGAAVAIEDGGSLVDQGSSYVSNLASAAGGAVWARDSVVVELTDLTVSQNEADDGDGGALWFSEIESLSLHSSDFEDNRASLSGGAIWIETALDPIELTDLRFTGNQAESGSGGAVLAEDLSVALESIQLSENLAGSDGGAIWATSVAEWSMHDSIFESNQTGEKGAGGALWLSFVETLTVSDSLFCDNRASQGGAVSAFYMHGSESWTGNTFQENLSEGDGGALHITYSPDHTAQNNTFVGNRADGSGGTIWAAGLTTDFVNNIVGYTQAGDGLYLDDSASDSDSSIRYSNWIDNLSTDASGSSTLDTSMDGHLSVDPGFSDYSLDGDCNNDVFTLLTDSALIDAGDPTLFDEDGTVSDIGAGAALAPDEDDPDDTGDTGAGDTGTVDTGAVDTGAVDTGAVDTGVSDTGEPQGPSDSGLTHDTAEGSEPDSGAGDSGGDESATDAGPSSAADEPATCGCASPRTQRRPPYGGLGVLLLGLLYGRRRSAISGSPSSQSPLG